jgi:carboxymethylenebutenolidase
MVYEFEKENLMSIHRTNLKLIVDGKSVNAYLASPEEGEPGVLVLHAWWGLKPFFKKLCDHLAEQGFVALAPDLNNGQIAGTIDEAKALMEKHDTQFMDDIIMTAKDTLLNYSGVTGNKIGVMGFSMGAAWTLTTAAFAPEQVAAAVLFYGIGEANFSKIKAKVLGHFSDVDEWEPMDGIRWVESELTKASVDTTFHIYPGLAHWFVEDDRPEFNPEAADLAWSRTFTFLRDTLQ